MPRETTHSAECWRWHPDCAYERGRAEGAHRVTRLNTDDPVDEECDCEIGRDHG